MKITGLDTNALITFRLKRKPYFNEVNKLFDLCVLQKASIFIPAAVFLESEWVFRSYYKQDKETILSFFEELLLLDNILTNNKEEIKFALNLYRDSNKISFTDSIIITAIKSKDYEFLTFDRDLQKIYQSLL